MGRNERSTPNESFRSLVDMKILNGSNPKKKNRAQLVQGINLPQTRRLEGWSPQSLDMSDADRQDR